MGKFVKGENIVNERREWLQHRIDYNGNYHHHKESMAWVATALYLTGIMVIAFEARRMTAGCCVNKIIFSLFFLLSCLFILSFVKWQFDRRWMAHKRVWWGVDRLQKAIFYDLPIIEPTEELEEIPRKGKQYCEATKYLIKGGLWSNFRPSCKSKHICGQLQPIVSEVITYAAIILVTVVAILIVCLSGIICPW
jgi:hypothetical protein